MSEKERLEKELKELGISDDDLWDVCQALTPIMELVKKYKSKPKHLQTMFSFILKELELENHSE
jgi:hypothetical protein